MQLPSKPFSGLRRVSTDDKELLAMQLQLDETLQRISSLPILNGSLISGLTASVTDTDVYVYHELGRLTRGYVLTSANGAMMLYSSQTTNPFPDRQIILRPNYSGGGTRTFNVWVF